MRRKRIAQVFTMAVLLAATAIMVMPYAWMALSAFKSQQEFAAAPNKFWISRPTLENFRGALDPGTGRMGLYLFNSLLYASTVTVFQLALNSLAAFAFARLKFRGRDVLFTILLSTMMLPFAVRLVPQYLIAVNLGIVDTLPGVVAPSLAGAFGIFLLRQFFLNIPSELEAAARAADDVARLHARRVEVVRPYARGWLEHAREGEEAERALHEPPPRSTNRVTPSHGLDGRSSGASSSRQGSVGSSGGVARS